MATTIRVGDEVQLNRGDKRDDRFPLRYEGRWGEVLKVEKNGKRTFYHVAMPQRTNPLILGRNSFLTV